MNFVLSYSDGCAELGQIKFVKALGSAPEIGLHGVSLGGVWDCLGRENDGRVEAQGLDEANGVGIVAIDGWVVRREPADEIDRVRRQCRLCVTHLSGVDDASLWTVDFGTVGALPARHSMMYRPMSGVRRLR